MLGLSSTELAGCVALLNETKLWPVLRSRLKGATGAKDLDRSLQASISQLEAKARPDLVLSLLGRMAEICDVPGKHYKAERDFEDHAAEIIDGAIKAYKKQNKTFTGSTLTELMPDQLGRLFVGLKGKFESLSKAEQEAFLDKLEGFIDALPQEQQEALKNALGTDQISRSLLRKAVVTGSLSAALMVAAQFGGFAFYTTAVSMLAGAAGLLGITVPFAAYTGLTSSLAILVNPLFLLIATGGFLYYVTGRGTKKLQENLVPLVITQILMCSQRTDTGSAPESSKNCLHAWQSALSTVHHCQESLSQAEAAWRKLRSQYRELKAELRALEIKAQRVTEEVRLKTTVLKALSAPENHTASVPESQVSETASPDRKSPTDTTSNLTGRRKDKEAAVARQSA